MRPFGGGVAEVNTFGRGPGSSDLDVSTCVTIDWIIELDASGSDEALQQIEWIRPSEPNAYVPSRSG